MERYNIITTLKRPDSHSSNIDPEIGDVKMELDHDNTEYDLTSYIHSCHESSRLKTQESFYLQAQTCQHPSPCLCVEEGMVKTEIDPSILQLSQDQHQRDFNEHSSLNGGNTSIQVKTEIKQEDNFIENSEFETPGATGSWNDSVTPNSAMVLDIKQGELPFHHVV